MFILVDHMNIAGFTDIQALNFVLAVETRVCLERGRACEAGVAHRADVRAEVGVGLQVLQRDLKWVCCKEI